MFSASAGSFTRTDAAVVRKSSVTSGGPIVVTLFPGLATGTGAGPYTPQGVDNFDPAATEGYFIGVDNAAQFSVVASSGFAAAASSAGSGAFASASGAGLRGSGLRGAGRLPFAFALEPDRGRAPDLLVLLPVRAAVLLGMSVSLVASVPSAPSATRVTGRAETTSLCSPIPRRDTRTF